jgi:ribose transport system permease protein
VSAGKPGVVKKPAEQDPASGAKPAGAGNGTATTGFSLATAKSWGRRLLSVECLPVLIATLILVAIIGALKPAFLATANLHDVLQQSVYVAVLAAGLAFLIGMREIDLSVGSVFALTLIIGALFMQHGMNPWLAVVFAIGLGGVMGLINALLVQVIAIPAIVATLATLSMFRGLSLALTDGQQVTGLPTTSKFFTIFGHDFLGFPVTAIVMIAIGILLTVVLRLTPFGYRVRSIGSNPEAATFSGISIARVRIQALVMMGLLGGVAGVLGLAFFQTGDPNIGIGLEFQAIAAAVIGGTPLSGGRASVAGAMIGAVLLSVVSNGLVYFSVPINWSQFATGAVILAAVGLDSLVRRRRKASRPGSLGRGS